MARESRFREDGKPRNGGLLGPIWDSYAVKANMIQCPYCRKRINKETVKCGFCNEWLMPPEQAQAILEKDRARKKIDAVAGKLLWAVVIVAIIGFTFSKPDKVSTVTTPSVSRDIPAIRTVADQAGQSRSDALENLTAVVTAEQACGYQKNDQFLVGVVNTLVSAGVFQDASDITPDGRYWPEIEANIDRIKRLTATESQRQSYCANIKTNLSAFFD